ncbi:hypothetical protein HPO_00460 [Hyphomonas polymorpha PS728]|uniref:Polyketide cyclase/dehydrase n=1 Tax=Hyphomonas polymorpha PS728 TaxID=1280954 RepID=A0A062VD42_9PROT|nr:MULTISPECIES: SRPBCC family protein [Hyphomonas]AXE63237.1 hypothetical protein BBF93_02665 [Hyphomonas sp. CACIAM 19H1]KDA00455.1 hypothetical protein HPO_00460 [Hyphomonas polymorpha PS728]
MASVHLDIGINAPADAVWSALASTGEAHKIFAPVLSGCRLESADVRIATFANGMVVKERIIDVDADRMRIAYAVIESAFVHHNASMQVVAADDGTCRFVWTADLLPHAAIDDVGPLMRAGALALKQNMESAL